jgi:hypothetical protein
VEDEMIVVAAIVGSLFIGCLFGVVVLEKPWVRVAMLLIFGAIAFMVVTAWHHAELGKQRARLMHEQRVREQPQEQTEGDRQPQPGRYR